MMYATFIEDVSDIPTVRVLIETLRRVKSAHPLICLANPLIPDGDLRNIPSQRGSSILDILKIKSEKILYLSPDCLVLNNIDHLFELEAPAAIVSPEKGMRPRPSAKTKGVPSAFNILLLKPVDTDVEDISLAYPSWNSLPLNYDIDLNTKIKGIPYIVTKEKYPDIIRTDIFDGLKKDKCSFCLSLTKNFSHSLLDGDGYSCPRLQDYLS